MQLVQDNFTLWLSEYRVDGFRWDTPGLMMNAANYGYISSAGNLINAINAMIHTNYTGKLSIAEDVYNSFGFDSAWDTSYPYSVTPVLTNTVDANRDMNAVANAVQYNVRYGGLAGPKRVAFLESHDVVGDLNAGVRLVSAIDAGTPASYRARKLSTLGATVTFTAPGVPMLFQGQEMLENQSFDSSRPVDWSKTTNYSYIVRYYQDLIGARRDLKGYTPGLEGDQCSLLRVDNVSKLLAFHRWKSATPNQDAVVIANFAGVTVSNYSLSFPSAGSWYVHLNSDSTNYGPDYGNIGNSVITATGSPALGNITLGPYSALVLSQTPNTLPQLTITQTNGAVVVSWPSSYFEWVLDQGSTLSGRTTWTEIPAAQYQTSGSTSSVSISTGGSESLFRLRK